MKPREIVIATRNLGKLRELQHLTRSLPVEFRSLADFPQTTEAEETGNSFMANAVAKGVHYSLETGRWTLADDSGLEVDALGGEPGLYSARFAGEPRSDDANNAKLIQLLQNTPPEKRTARFRCAVALVDGRHTLATAEGVIEGVIVDEPRGDNGFGYDPHFWVPEHNMTTAEMKPEVKNRVSHRGRALAAIIPEIERLVSQS